MMINDEAFIEIECSQLIKGGEAVAGDDFKTEVLPNDSATFPFCPTGWAAVSKQLCCRI